MLRFFAAVGVAFACIFGFVALSVAWILVTTPRPNDIRGCIVTKLYEVRLCPGEPQYVPLRAISPVVRAAVIASEDGTFYQHHGFDWFEMRESAEKNWSQGKFARGGSTITQQLAKNVYLTKEKSLLRKLREALIVYQLEGSLSKDEILEKYLNVVELGPDVFGVGPAAKYYFGKSPGQLDAVEASFIAFLLPNPEKYSASFRAKKLTKFARNQIKIILGRLWKLGKISEAQHEAGLAKLDSFFGVAPDMKDEGDDAEAPLDIAPTMREEPPAIHENAPEDSGQQDEPAPAASDQPSDDLNTDP